MNIFLLRHGHALSEASCDSHRTLSPQGELEVHGVCQEAYEELKHVEHVFYSPYVRAKQTAEITEQYLTAPQEACDLLTPNGRVGSVIEFLYGAADAYGSVLLVSHQPLIGTLVDALGGFESGRYRMGTASLASLVCDPVASECCELNWLKHP